MPFEKRRKTVTAKLADDKQQLITQEADGNA